MIKVSPARYANKCRLGIHHIPSDAYTILLNRSKTKFDDNKVMSDWCPLGKHCVD